MTHKPVQNDFDGWDFDGWATDDVVGLVEYEISEISEPKEQILAPSGPQVLEKVDFDPPQRLSFTPRRSQPNGRLSPQQAFASASSLGIDATAPGALAKPSAPIVNRNAEQYPEQYPEPCIDPFAPMPLEGWEKVQATRRSLLVRWRGLLRHWPWRLAWLSSLAVGSCAAVLALGRGQQAEMMTETGLRDKCLAVMNADGTVSGDKANGVAQLVGKEGQALTKSLGAPYCALPKTSMRSGAILERSLYQVEGDRLMVVASEGDRVIGYDIQSPGDGSSANLDAEDRQDFDLRQSWGWLTGSRVSERVVVGGLGSIALATDGPVHAPMDGVVYEEAALVAEGQLSRLPDSCAVFGSVELPGYAVQLCGLRDRKVGAVEKGDVIGRGEALVHMAVLRRDGKQWMFVPPSPEIVERVLGKSA
ncbi:MAG: hypothetical protein AAGF75_08610 [Cyanobacteria bacterium P01_H01_bin.130]